MLKTPRLERTCLRVRASAPSAPPRSSADGTGWGAELVASELEGEPRPGLPVLGSSRVSLSSRRGGVRVSPWKPRALLPPPPSRRGARRPLVTSPWPPLATVGVAARGPTTPLAHPAGSARCPVCGAGRCGRRGPRAAVRHSDTRPRPPPPPGVANAGPPALSSHLALRVQSGQLPGAPLSKGQVRSRGRGGLKVLGGLPRLGPTHEKASRRVPGRGSRRLGGPVSFGASLISPKVGGAGRPRVGPSVCWARPSLSPADAKTVIFASLCLVVARA